MNTCQHVDVSDIDSDVSGGNFQELTGPSVATEVTWTKKVTTKNITKFMGRTGPSDEILKMEDKSPLQLFLTLLSLNFIDDIVFETNLYGHQMGKLFSYLDLPEFLAINLLMGIKRMPSYRDYWSSSPELNDAYISSLSYP